MTPLGQKLTEALAQTFALYFKAHAAHWNVEGPLFSELHSLFASIYADAFGAVDDIAERIRTLDEYAPRALSEMADGGPVPNEAMAMVADLQAMNETARNAVQAAYEQAENAGNAGLSNFLQVRLDKHARWDWMLKATGKGKSRTEKRYVMAPAQG